MMRLSNRFYALCAVAACTILFSAWALTSRTYGDITLIKSAHFQTATEFEQRLVVFGDSWSDNEAEERQGKAWTDWLCSMVRIYLGGRDGECLGLHGGVLCDKPTDKY